MAKRKVEELEVVCDVCGKEADGEWYGTEYLNGEVFSEYSCPLDLCKEHMRVFALYFSNYKTERYDKTEEEKCKELLQKMKDFEQKE